MPWHRSPPPCYRWPEYRGTDLTDPQLQTFRRYLRVNLKIRLRLLFECLSHSVNKDVTACIISRFQLCRMVFSTFRKCKYNYF